MSKSRIIPLEQTANAKKPLSARRWSIYAAIGVACVLAIAYFDGGEEPIHPISQQIALPADSEARLRTSASGVAE